MASTPIRVPVRDILVDSTGAATKVFQDYMQADTAALPAIPPLYATNFGVVANGKSDATAGLQAAINQAVTLKGQTIVLPAGTIMLGSVSIPAGTSPIRITGQGDATILQRSTDLAAGVGLFDITGANVMLDNFQIDGGVTTPVGLLYGHDFQVGGQDDPLAPALTLNTSIWLHTGADNFYMERVTITHTGGYAVLVDASIQPPVGTAAAITNFHVSRCRFENNRPHLFGTTLGQAIYGSWTGGILIRGDGRTAGHGQVVSGILVDCCTFSRMTGNAFWMHALGLNELHTNVRVISNSFEDIGLDGVEIGAAVGGAVSGNYFRRIGYTTLTDTDSPVPRWLTGYNATGLDSSGLVKLVNYQGNSFLSVNGGAIDGDGHCESALVGNVVRIPVSGDPEYIPDSIATSGASNSGSTSSGINLGNSSNTQWGGQDITICGNTLLNLPNGAIRLYSARNCLVIGNDIVSPNAPNSPPIAMGPVASTTYRRSTGNVIKMNRFVFSPASSGTPFVVEDNSLAAFTGTDVNTVCSNCPVIGNGNAIEFQKDASSGSTVYSTVPWV